MKSVLLVIPNLNFGGAQKSLATLSRELSSQYKIYVVHFNKHFGVDFELGGELISLEVNAGSNVISKISNFFKRIIRLRRIKKEKQIDLAISFLEGADFINILSFGTARTIISVRGSKRSDETIKGVIGWIRHKVLIPLIYPLANSIVAVNEGIKSELINFYNVKEDRVSVINNFYEIDVIQRYSKEEFSYNEKDFYKGNYLISVGRLAPEKGGVYLLKIFASLKRKGYKGKLMFVGDGPIASMLYEQCERLNLSYTRIGEIGKDEDVLFIGFRKNIYKYMKHADLFLLTSSSEGFPNALAESMICGIPVVSADCPWGPREILAPNTKHSRLKDAEFAEYGILMPLLKDEVNIIECWSSTILNFLNDGKLMVHYTGKGKERMSDFSREKISGKWIEVINQQL